MCVCVSVSVCVSLSLCVCLSVVRLSISAFLSVHVYVLRYLTLDAHDYMLACIRPIQLYDLTFNCTT